MPQKRSELQDITGKWQTEPGYLEAAAGMVAEHFSNHATMALCLYSSRIEHGAYIVIFAVASNRSFRPTSFMLTSEAEAHSFVDKLNEQLGIDGPEAIRIADSALGPQGRMLH